MNTILTILGTTNGDLSEESPLKECLERRISSGAVHHYILSQNQQRQQDACGKKAIYHLCKQSSLAIKCAELSDELKWLGKGATKIILHG